MPIEAMYLVTAGHDIGAPSVQGRTPAEALEIAERFRQLGHPVVVIRDTSAKIVTGAELKAILDQTG